MAKELAKPVLMTLMRQAAQVGVGVVTLILITRTLGVADTGHYSLAALTLTLLVALCNGGVQTANIYYLARKQISPLTALRVLGVLWLVGMVCLYAPAVALVWGLGLPVLPDAPARLLLIVLLAVPFNLAQIWFVSFAQGRENFVQFNRLSLQPLVLTMLLTGSVFAAGYKTVEAAALALLASQVVSAALSLQVVWGMCRGSEVSSVRPWLWNYVKFGGPNYLSNLLPSVSRRIDSYFVGWFLGPTALGIYNVARDISERMMMPTNAITTVLLPRLAHMHTQDGHKAAANRMTPVMARLGFAITLAGASVASLLAPFVFPLLFGRAFAASVPVFCAVAMMLPLTSVTWILSNDMTARGRPWLNVWSIAGLMVAQVAIAFAAIPTLGMLGGVLTIAGSQIGGFLVKLMMFARLSGQSLREVLVPGELDRELLMAPLQSKKARILLKKVGLMRKAS